MWRECMTTSVSSDLQKTRFWPQTMRVGMFPHRIKRALSRCDFDHSPSLTTDYDQLKVAWHLSLGTELTQKYLPLVLSKFNWVKSSGATFTNFSSPQIFTGWCSSHHGDLLDTEERRRMSGMRPPPPMSFGPPTEPSAQRPREGVEEASGGVCTTYPGVPVPCNALQNCAAAGWGQFWRHTVPCPQNAPNGANEVGPILMPLSAPGAEPAQYCRRTCEGTVTCGQNPSTASDEVRRGRLVYGDRAQCTTVHSALPNRCGGGRDRLDAAPCPGRRTCLAPPAGLGGCGVGLWGKRGLKLPQAAAARGVILPKSLGDGFDAVPWDPALIVECAIPHSPGREGVQGYLYLYMYGVVTIITPPSHLQPKQEKGRHNF
ncbi:hypothetical protein B0H16DRAFT_1698307 [Mycena metata]|uniref:Uncharacterized protein n=1 Tax=Mycena metata TaxID=1033252 RepID=A0AAD7HPU8_9AGAR|nr:hypothetical protein B0H16DRAFT_1698307 [Mycena metata]